MSQNNNILQELKELGSSLLGSDPQNIYTVPAGYFDGLADQVMARIKALEANNVTEELTHLSPLLNTISKQMPYDLPTGYFDSLEKKLTQIVLEKNNHQSASEEIETLSPLLSGLSKKMPYAVPEGYFETLSKNKEENVRPAAKVVSITKQKWFRIAAAAVITGVIVLGALLYFNRGNEKEPGGKVLAKFTKDVKKMDEAQKDNLIDFIDAGLSGQETAQVTPDTKSTGVKELLNDVSDAELKDFQEQTEDIEGVLMTN